MNNLGKGMWLCKCKCGIVKSVHAHSIRIGESTSCGCFRSELIRIRKTTHGLTNTPTYHCWANMRQRCEDSNCIPYKNYGGRGIKVCDRWLDFENFLADMGFKPSPMLSIERIDVNGNYEPGNCRWATKLEQANNRRTNVWVEKDGIRLTVAQWEKKLGFSKGLVKMRIRNGWTPIESVTLAPSKRGCRKEYRIE